MYIIWKTTCWLWGWHVLAENSSITFDQRIVPAFSINLMWPRYSVLLWGQLSLMQEGIVPCLLRALRQWTLSSHLPNRFSDRIFSAARLLWYQLMQSWRLSHRLYCLRWKYCDIFHRACKVYIVSQHCNQTRGRGEMHRCTCSSSCVLAWNKSADIIFAWSFCLACDICAFFHATT